MALACQSDRFSPSVKLLRSLDLLLPSVRLRLRGAISAQVLIGISQEPESIPVDVGDLGPRFPLRRSSHPRASRIGAGFTYTRR